MKISERIRNFIVKLQNLPENRKLIILWSIVVILGLGMGLFWINNVMHTISKIEQNFSGIVGGPNISSLLPSMDTTTSAGLQNLINKQVPQDSSDWKTYSNYAYGFEIKYPKEWFIEASKSEDIYISKVSPEEGDAPFKNSALQIHISKVNSQTTLRQAVENKLTYQGSMPDLVQENIKIGSQDGLKITTLCEGVGCKVPEWFMIKDSYLYDFSSGLGYEPSFDTILSTFEFTQ